MSLNKNIVYATIPAGFSLQDVTELYKYRHLDAEEGGHVLTISAYGPTFTLGGTPTMTIRANFANDYLHYADLDAVDITSLQINGYLKTFSMTGFYDINIFNDAVAGDINVEISS